MGQGPAMSAFAQALRSGKGDALRFLDAAPGDDAGWRSYLDRAAEASSDVSVELAERLAARQHALGAGSQAVANARALADGALAVVTGQQPGLLGGPLLTFHKAAGAIALARRLDGIAGRRVVPVFWLASEDHDLDEANRAGLLDRQGQLRKLRLPLAADGRSVMDVHVPSDTLDAFMADVRASLPETERGHVAEALAAPVAGEDFATWCARSLLAVFGDAGLVMVEPPVLAPDVGPTYAWLLDNAEAIQESIATRGTALEDAGLPAPLAPKPGETTLFFREREGGPRLRVGLTPDGALTLRGEPSSMSRDELRATLLADPMRGSGNVAGRVLVQNRHLPVVAYIAGPTEIAYQAQLRAAHETLGRFFPLALPRPEGTWLDTRASDVLEAFGRTPADVLAGAIEPPAADDHELAEALRSLAAQMAELEERAAGLLDRGGRGAEALRRALDRTAQTWSKAEASIRAAFEADAGVGRARWARMLNLIQPTGKPQDRVLSPLSLIARHGVDAVRQGLASLDPLLPVHHLLHLEG